MKINHHYGESYDRNLLDFLLSIGFAKEDLLEEYSRLIVFDIYDDDERLPLIKEKYPDWNPAVLGMYSQTKKWSPQTGLSCVPKTGSWNRWT